MVHRWLPLLLAVLWASPTAAAEPIQDPAWGEGCTLLTAAVYHQVPGLFYEDRADSLLTLLDRWESYCGPDEVIGRTLILGAIWDGAFGEDLYDARVIDDLVQRGAQFRDDAPATPARAAYDSFTVDLANQLLPHQPAGSLEEFFCLFYSGRTAEAWALADNGDLAGTDLVYYRDRRLILLGDQPSRLRLAMSVGNWYPVGDLEFVGPKPLLGLMASWWEELWFGRLVGEWRPGRTDVPYWTEHDGGVYLSDRWDALLLGGEAGRRLLGGDDWRLDVFAGVGVDMVKPLGGSKDVLAALHVSIGGGIRYDLGPERRWYLGCDLRSETVGDRNGDAVNLGGDAWSVRFVMGRIMTSSDQDTVELLGR